MTIFDSSSWFFSLASLIISSTFIFGTLATVLRCNIFSLFIFFIFSSIFFASHLTFLVVVSLSSPAKIYPLSSVTTAIPFILVREPSVVIMISPFFTSSTKPTAPASSKFQSILTRLLLKQSSLTSPLTVTFHTIASNGISLLSLSVSIIAFLALSQNFLKIPSTISYFISFSIFILVFDS